MAKTKKSTKRDEAALLAQLSQTLSQEKTLWGKVKSYYNNEPLMTRVGIDTSLLISLFFIGVNLWNGIFNQAIWSFLFVGYYVLLDTINGLMLKSLRKKPSIKKERAEVRLVGYIMVGMDFVFLAMLSQMIIFDARESYNLMIVIAGSLYTVYRIAIAVYNMVRTRHLKSPTLIATKYIGMIAVLISAAVLQASVMGYIGADNWTVRAITSVVGLAVFIAVFVLSGFLIHNHQE